MLGKLSNEHPPPVKLRPDEDEGVDPDVQLPLRVGGVKQSEAICQADPPLLKLLCTLGHILPVENTLGSNFPVMVNFFRAEPTLSVVKDSGQSSTSRPTRHQVCASAKNSSRAFSAGKALHPLADWGSACGRQHLLHLFVSDFNSLVEVNQAIKA